MYIPDVETRRGTSLRRGKFHAADFIHYMFIYGNIAATQHILVLP